MITGEFTFAAASITPLIESVLTTLTAGIPGKAAQEKQWQQK